MWGVGGRGVRVRVSRLLFFLFFHCVVALTMGDAAEVQGDRGFP